MNGKYLLGKMELIDPAYIEAADKKPEKKPIMWQRWTALAACITVAVISGTIMVISPDNGVGTVDSGGDTASLFSNGGIPLIIFVASSLAAIAVAAVMIKKKKK